MRGGWVALKHGGVTTGFIWTRVCSAGNDEAVCSQVMSLMENDGDVPGSSQGGSHSTSHHARQSALPSEPELLLNITVSTLHCIWPVWALPQGHTHLTQPSLCSGAFLRHSGNLLITYWVCTAAQPSLVCEGRRRTGLTDPLWNAKQPWKDLNLRYKAAACERRAVPLGTRTLREKLNKPVWAWPQASKQRLPSLLKIKHQEFHQCWPWRTPKLSSKTGKAQQKLGH